LSNGLTIVGVRQPRNHGVCLSAYIGAGTRHEKPAQRGISHFLEHLLFQGAGSFRSAAELVCAVEALGGQTNAFTMPEYTGFYVSAHRRHWERALDILLDVVASPHFSREHIEKEKRIVVQEMRHSVGRSGRNYNIDDLAYNLLWAPEQRDASPIGEERRIRSFSHAGLMRFYRRHYRSSAMVFALAGAFPWEEAVRRIRKRSAVVSGPVPSPRKRALPLRRVPGRIFRKADWPVVAVKLCHRAFPHHHRNFPPTLVLDEILGGGSASRLILRMREERGLVYDISSEIASFSDVGSLDISTTVDSAHLVEAVREILAVVGDLLREGLSEQELTQFRERVSCQFDLMQDDPTALGDWYARQELMFHPARLESPTMVLNKLESITLKDVNRAARAVFQVRNRNLAVVGPYRDGDRARLERLRR
jgi:predicted Zn-dependent peptidase